MKKLHFVSFIMACMLCLVFLTTGCDFLSGNNNGGGNNKPIFPDDSSFEDYKPVQNDDIISVSLNKASCIVHANSTFEDFCANDLSSFSLFVEKKLSGKVEKSITKDMIDSSTWDTSKKGSFNLLVNYKGFENTIKIDVMDVVEQEVTYTHDGQNYVFFDNVTLLLDGTFYTDGNVDDIRGRWTREGDVITFYEFDKLFRDEVRLLYKADDKNHVLSTYKPSGTPSEKYIYTNKESNYSITVEIYGEYTTPGYYLSYSYYHDEKNPNPLCAWAYLDKELSQLNVIGDMMVYFEGNTIYDLSNKEMMLKCYKAQVISMMKLAWKEANLDVSLDASSYDKHYKDIYNEVLNAKSKIDTIIGASKFSHLLSNMGCQGNIAEVQKEIVRNVKDIEIQWNQLPKDIKENPEFVSEIENIEISFLYAYDFEDLKNCTNRFKEFMDRVQNGGGEIDKPDRPEDEYEYLREDLNRIINERYNLLLIDGYDVTSLEPTFKEMRERANKIQSREEFINIEKELSDIINEFRSNNKPDYFRGEKNRVLLMMQDRWSRVIILEEAKKLEQDYLAFKNKVNTAKDVDEIYLIEKDFNDFIKPLEKIVEEIEFETNRKQILKDLDNDWRKLQQDVKDIAPFVDRFNNIKKNVENAKTNNELYKCQEEFQRLIDEMLGNEHSGQDTQFEEHKNESIKEVVDKWNSLLDNFNGIKYQDQFDAILDKIKNAQNEKELVSALNEFYGLNDEIQSKESNKREEALRYIQETYNALRDEGYDLTKYDNEYYKIHRSMQEPVHGETVEEGLAEFNKLVEKIKSTEKAKKIYVDNTNFTITLGSDLESFFNANLKNQKLHVKDGDRVYDVDITLDMVSSSDWEIIKTHVGEFHLGIKYNGLYTYLNILVEEGMKLPATLTFSSDTRFSWYSDITLDINNTCYTGNDSYKLDIGTFEINGNILKIIYTNNDVYVFTIDEINKTLSYYKPNTLINTYELKDDQYGFTVSVYGEYKGTGEYYFVENENGHSTKYTTVIGHLDKENKIITLKNKKYTYDDATNLLEYYLSKEFIALRDSKIKDIEVKWNELINSGIDVTQHEDRYNRYLNELKTSIDEYELNRNYDLIIRLIENIKKENQKPQ